MPGANVDLEDPYGVTPLMAAASHGQCRVARCRVARILLQFGADSNRVLDKNNWSALQFVSRFGHLEMVTMLLDAGVDKDLTGW